MRRPPLHVLDAAENRENVFLPPLVEAETPLSAVTRKKKKGRRRMARCITIPCETSYTP